LATQLGATQAAVIAMLRSLGHDDVPVERLPEMLASAATQILTLRQALTRPSNDERGTADLKGQAVSALDAGEFDEATRLLNVIRARERDASERRRRAADDSRADWLAGLQSEAETCTLLARAALAQRNVAAANAQFEDGLRILAPADPERRWEYGAAAADVLYHLGNLAGLSEALVAAIQLYRQALADAPRQRVPHTQNNLGNALQVLGDRETGVVRLEEALVAYRAAQEEWTRNQAPLRWANVQNNIGNVLVTLGERERGTARLEEAVAAYCAALEEYSREREPLDWAMTQNNLGAAFTRLGTRETGTGRLEKAVAAHRAALQEFTRERTPLEWAQTQSNLGSAIAALGARESGTARLEEAETAFHAALEELTRERAPHVWAMTQNNLGLTLRMLGERERRASRLEKAVAAHRAALTEWTRERVPLEWANAQSNLGSALAHLGVLEGKVAPMKEAVAAWDACLTIAESTWPPEPIQSLRSVRDGVRAGIAELSASRHV
jgi:tetratricopeptide (TPR) repeat protein